VATEEDFQRHDRVYKEARSIYEERDKVRDGLWKEYTPRDQMVQTKIKVERVLSLLDKQPEGYEEHVLKEMPDIINYAIFATRLLRPLGGAA
jgi:hypothetical protein